MDCDFISLGPSQSGWKAACVDSVAESYYHLKLDTKSRESHVFDSSPRPFLPLSHFHVRPHVVEPKTHASRAPLRDRLNVGLRHRRGT